MRIEDLYLNAENNTPIVCKVNNDIITKITIMPAYADNVVMRVDVSKKYQEKEYKEELNDIISRIKLVTKRYVSSPIAFEMCLGNMCVCEIMVNMCVSNSNESISLLQQSIEAAANVQYTGFKKEFIDALSVENHYARFILLYGLLYEAVKTRSHGSQQDLDKYAQNYFKNKNIANKPKMLQVNVKGNVKNVTIYTYLRNCYGHLSSNVDIEDTNKKIDDILEEFTEIVYCAIF